MVTATTTTQIVHLFFHNKCCRQDKNENREFYIYLLQINKLKYFPIIFFLLDLQNQSRAYDIIISILLPHKHNKYSMKQVHVIINNRQYGITLQSVYFYCTCSFGQEHAGNPVFTLSFISIHRNQNAIHGRNTEYNTFQLRVNSGHVHSWKMSPSILSTHSQNQSSMETTCSNIVCSITTKTHVKWLIHLQFFFKYFPSTRIDLLLHCMMNFDLNHSTFQLAVVSLEQIHYITIICS